MAAIGFWLWLAAGAAAAQGVRILPSLVPADPGKRTKITFAASFEGGPGRLPAPLSSAEVLLPEGLTNMRLAWPRTRGCSIEAMLERGPRGCPPRSLVGFGAAEVGLEAGGVVERARASLLIFVGPTNGAYVLNVLGAIPGRLQVRFAFTEQLSAVSAPFSSGVETSFAGAFTPAVRWFTMVVGANHLPRRLDHRHLLQRLFAPLRLYTPDHCPRGGFRWRARFGFADGTTTEADAVTTCP